LDVATLTRNMFNDSLLYIGREIMRRLQIILTLLLISFSLSSQQPIHRAWTGREDTIYVDDISAIPGTIIIDPGVVYQERETYNAEAIALFARMNEQPDAFTKTLISNTIDSLKDKGLWSKLYLFYGLAGYSDSSILENWIDTAYSLTIASVYNKPYFIPYSGIQSNQASTNRASYFKTNFNPSTELDNDSTVTYGIYLDDKYKAFAAVTNWGAYDGSINNQVQIGRQASIGGVGTVRNVALNNSVNINLTSENHYGLFNFIRNKSNIKIYNGLSKIYDAASTYTASINKDLYLAATNYSVATALFPSRSTIAFFYIGKLFSEDDVTNMNNIISDYMSATAHLKDVVTYDNDYLYYKINREFNINNVRILYQSGDKKLLAANDTVYLTLDGTTFYRKLLTETRRITNGYIWPDNSVILTNTFNKIYVSNDSLTTLNEITLKDTDGDNYVYHTPVSETYPGDYFNTISQIKEGNQTGVDMIVLPHYANVNLGGAAPVNIYYSADTGRTFKVAYKFGQNPNYRDNGFNTGVSTGTLLGDASNSIIARHVHDVVYSSYDTAWYACTGDAIGETMWLRGKYTIATDSWVWDSIANTSLGGRFKSAGLNMVGDTLYFSADDNLIKTDNGIFKCHIKDILDTTKHINLNPSALNGADMIIVGDTIIQAASDNSGITISKDLGNTWSPYIQFEEYPTPVMRSKLTKPDSDGWFTISDIGISSCYNIGGGTIRFKLK
jgi:hypothetical protein